MRPIFKIRKINVCFVMLLFLVQSVTVVPDVFSQENAAVTAPDSDSAGSLPRPGNITVNFKEVDILTILNYLSEVSGVDIIPTPGVEGLVTMRLRDKPWEIALDIVTRNYGFAYSREENIIRVMPRAMLQAEEPVTKVIPLKHVTHDVELEKTGTSGLGESVSAEVKEESIRQIMGAIRSIIDTRRGENVTYISTVNALVITAIPQKMNKILEILEMLDKRPPQVLLEAKVVEVILNDDEKLGIDWDAIISAAGARRPTTVPFTNTGQLPFLQGDQNSFYPTHTVGDNDATFPPASSSTWYIDAIAAPVSDSVFSFGTLDFSSFEAVLRMIQERSDTDILSTPRITTLNNQKATIKVVERIMLQKAKDAVESGTTITVEFEKDADAREIGVKLTVIPHVNEDGEITVNLIPEVSSNLTFEELAVGNAGDDTSIAMTYDTREANTQVRVRDGETIFIGGLIKDKIVKTENKVPLLGDMFGDVPYLKYLFKYEAEEIDKTEIVFFVTVHIVKDGKDSIDKSNSEKFYKRYHNGFDPVKEKRIGKDLKLFSDKNEKQEIEKTPEKRSRKRVKKDWFAKTEEKNNFKK